MPDIGHPLDTGHRTHRNRRL